MKAISIILDDLIRANLPPVPSEMCAWCGEIVLAGEQHPGFPVQAMHGECGFRSVAGSVGHILRRCSCYSEYKLEDPPELTAREAAQAAFALWRQIVNWYGEEAAV